MQSAEDAKYLKRKIRSRTIDVHPTEQALVVNYELEALILGDLGDPLLGNKKECQKIIRLKSLNPDTNCSALAKEVVDKCSLIHPSKIEEVEHLIHYLQKRSIDNSLNPNVIGPVSDSRESPCPNSSSSSSDGYGEKASITDIEAYVELLYEEINQKVKGSALILNLARSPDNLFELGNNESVLSALARVLREDWKQSLDLSTNIVYIFFCFSVYTVFHNVILQYKVGSLCMEVIDSELRRFDQFKEDLETRRRRVDGLSGRASDGIKKPVELVSHIPVASADIRKRLSDDAKRKQAEGNSNELKDEAQRLREDYENRKQKFEVFKKKQEQLIRVSFYLLMNIAEDTKVEDKMRKKNICGMLAKTLDRDNSELLHLVVIFLIKLSLFRENIDDMIDLNVVEKLPKILALDNRDVIHVTLRLLYNMSFDSMLRERMVRVGFLPKLVKLMTDETHIDVVLKLLYHLSMDDRCKSMFTYTDCVPLAMGMLLSSDAENTPVELVALCVNLAINKRNAQMMVEDNRLQSLMTRAFQYQNSLIMKMIRNIAQHDSTKLNFIEFVGDIAKAIVQCESEDFVVECVGVLGNMTLPDLDFSALIREFGLIPWIQNILLPEKYEDDLVLDVVVLLGTAAMDHVCAILLCKADILMSLIELLKAKQEDDEMVLQIIYVFYQVSRHSATRDYLVKETEAPAYLVDLMHDKNTQISQVCNACLNIIADCNGEWAERIRREKFCWHNSQWLEMVENSSLDGSLLGNMDELPSYKNDLLDNSIFQSGMSSSYPEDRMMLGKSDCDIDEEGVHNSFACSSRASSRSSGEDIILGPR